MTKTEFEVFNILVWLMGMFYFLWFLFDSTDISHLTHGYIYLIGAMILFRIDLLEEQLHEKKN